MIKILSNKNFRLLFMAQAVSLSGSGLLTVALALLAFKLAGDQAGVVIGTALAIKIIAFVVGSPIAAVISGYLPRKAFLIALDSIRALAVLCLPFISEVWQVYAVVFVIQFSTAAFMPVFQAVIPEIIVDERDYTKALSLSRLASDLEMFGSPLLASVLLGILSFEALFIGTVGGFLLSAVFISFAILPATKRNPGRGVVDSITLGLRIFFATPRLRAFITLKMAVASAAAIVLVNTVVIVRDWFGLPETSVATAMVFYGSGSVIAAISLPFLLDRITDRQVMLGAGIILGMAMIGAMQATSLAHLLPFWVMVGCGQSLINTPVGRLLIRSSQKEDRSSIFAANFTLSHLCFLITYPVAGYLPAIIGYEMSFLVAGITAFSAVLIAYLLWDTPDQQVLHHHHAELPTDHPHFHEAGSSGRLGHSHIIVIDRLHTSFSKLK